MTFLDTNFKKFNVYVLYAALVAIAIAFGYCYFTNKDVDDKGIQGLKEQLEDGTVEKVIYRPVPLTGLFNLTVTSKNGTHKEQKEYFNVPSSMLWNQNGNLKNSNFTLTAEDQRPYWGYESVVIVALFCVKIIILYCLYLLLADTIEQVGNEMAMKKSSKNRKVVFNQKRFTFKDVAGVDEEKEEMSELIDF